jgi:hypothetical protein
MLHRHSLGHLTCPWRTVPFSQVTLAAFAIGQAQPCPVGPVVLSAPMPADGLSRSAVWCAFGAASWVSRRGCCAPSLRRGGAHQRQLSIAALGSRPPVSQLSDPAVVRTAHMDLPSRESCSPLTGARTTPARSISDIASGDAAVRADPGCAAATRRPSSHWRRENRPRRVCLEAGLVLPAGSLAVRCSSGARPRQPCLPPGTGSARRQCWGVPL